LKKRAKKDIIKGGPNVDIKGNRCFRCGYEWVSRRKGEVPTVCPKCKNAFWKKPRRKRKTNAKAN